MSYLRGVDISHWDTVEMPELVNAVDFVICKATQGQANVDPCFYDRFEYLERVGKLKGAYHFIDGTDPYTQARHFHDCTKVFHGSFIPIVDWEEYNGSIPNQEHVSLFVEEYFRLARVYPWIYGSRDALPWYGLTSDPVLSQCGFWKAFYYPVQHPDFTDAVNSGASPYCDCWQFCSDGIMKGCAGDTDLDIFWGDTEAWLKYCKPYDPPTIYPIVNVLWETEQYRLILEILK